MGEIFSVFVLADDRARDYENLARMLASDFVEESLLLGGRQIVQTFNGGYDVVTLERNAEEVRVFKACIRHSLRGRSADRNAADIDTLYTCCIPEKRLCKMAFT